MNPARGYGCLFFPGGLPLHLTFATKGELAIDLLGEAYADDVRLDFVAGDEVYGACTKLRTFLEEHGQAYVLRIRATFTLALGGGTLPDLRTSRGQASEAETPVGHPLGRDWLQGRAHLRLGLDRHCQPRPLFAGAQALQEW
ncbi:transposase [Nonomuraea sp. NPDC049400]|uniref:transposase n=1 Tax=Nonomuraea sp. NPDC049400 TaxID=3364352 RepID=UPI0037A286F5